MKFSEIDIDKLKVSGDRLLIRKEIPEETDGFKKTDSGILVASNADVGEKEPDNIGEVVKVGPDVMNQDLQVLNPDSGVLWKEGCEHPFFIIHQPFTGFPFKNGKYDYTILSEQDVLAVL